MSSSRAPRDRNGTDSSRPFSMSKSSSGPSKKPAFNLQSSSRSRPTNSPAGPNRSLPRRPHQLGHGDDSSDEEDRAPVYEEISGFDTHTGGALAADGQTISDAKQPLVIPVSSKNNWRERAGVNVKKGKKNLLPREVQALQEAQKNGQVPGSESAMETEGPSMAYGLSFAQKSADETKTDNDARDNDQAMADAKPLLPPPVEDNKPLTDDQIALQALIRESKDDVERRSDLVIKYAQGKAHDEEEEGPARPDEAGSFRTDVASRPESATLDAYNAIPVEEFGAALLRGMGWKDGQPIGRGQYGTSATADRDQANKPRVPERRPGFLGIGAKDTSGGKGAEAEFGAWGKSAMRKASRKQGEESANGVKTEGVYMPVMMRNKKTGENITEDELAALQKEAKSKPAAKEDDWRERRDRNLEKSGRDRYQDSDQDRHRDRDREYRRRDYDDEEDRSHRRNGSSRRDRSLSSGRHSSRRSRYEDDDDGRRDDRSHREHRDRDRERRRDRDGDRDRRRDRDRDRDRSHRYADDRYSSSRHSSHSSRHDRDRDSHRNRRND
ncbi:hypothetical protein NUU61_002833 [Penicillium alfredii]|uniref:Pre-mRNA-splicing factor n=1 Tax=Penicillium alfredii TaxID=1506179 RepID=A0A9W9FS84_9EURO|nr:uncharacterized protein NUU61_002833 [Penicillium alfredii]KAJ5105486.1 hypothetical protein NUU61_002833 [Penicillium alfredii]